MLFPFLVVSGCGSPPTNVPEGVYAVPSVCDLGTVIDAKTISGQFKIVNSTRKSVNIHKVKLSCGCANMELSGEKIPAGGSIDATLHVDLQGRYGQYVFEAHVLTNDISNPEILLQLSVNVAQKKLDGSIVFDLGSMGPGDPVNQTFSTLPGKVRSVTVENVKCSSDAKIGISVETFQNEKVILKVSGTAPEQNGAFFVEAKLKSEGTEWGEANVLFNGVVRPDISIPSSIPMGFLENGKTINKRVDFSTPADFFSKVRIDKMELVNPLPQNLSVKLVPSAMPCLEFSLAPTKEIDAFSQNLEIELFLSNGKKYRLSTVVIARFL